MHNKKAGVTWTLAWIYSLCFSCVYQFPVTGVTPTWPTPKIPKVSVGSPSQAQDWFLSRHQLPSEYTPIVVIPLPPQSPLPFKEGPGWVATALAAANKKALTGDP